MHIVADQQIDGPFAPLARMYEPMPSTTRRAAASSSANAKSAVVSVRTSGVFVTRMPLRVAAGTSMLSKPTATFAMISHAIQRVDHLGAERSVSCATTPCLPRGALLSSSARESVIVRNIVHLAVLFQIFNRFRIDAFGDQYRRLHCYHSLLWQSSDFLGLGLMGYPMARNLARAGHQVAVWSNTSAKAKQLAEEEKAIACATPAEVAQKSECIFICVGDTKMAEEVLLGAERRDRRRDPGTVVADASTIAPAASRAIGEKLSAKGIHFLDAPCTGSTPGATCRNVNLHGRRRPARSSSE